MTNFFFFFFLYSLNPHSPTGMAGSRLATYSYMRSQLLQPPLLGYGTNPQLERQQKSNKRGTGIPTKQSNQRGIIKGRQRKRQRKNNEEKQKKNKRKTKATVPGRSPQLLHPLPP